MKVYVDREKCQGHSRCVMLAPQLFDQDEQGYAFARSEDVPPGMEDLARQAEENCPESAISVTE
jgi:ferredoxin